MPKLRHPERKGLHIRVVLDGGAVFGPGRAELLANIRKLGSIAAAGRAMDMSYRRAWLLVEETTRDFGAPVVIASPGGARGGGAGLTPLGHRLLALYDAMLAKAGEAAAGEIAAMQALIVPNPSPGEAEQGSAEPLGEAELPGGEMA
jgi:molybdate transport system regulatory protein